MFNSNKKIKYAIVGCGRISKRHFEAIKQDPRCLVYAACDLDENKLNSVKEFYPSIKLYKNFSDVLDDKNIDVVNICTPSGLHAGMAILAAENGKNVIVEKPMAMLKKDAEKMIKIFSKNQKKLCVVLQNRFNQAIQVVLNEMSKLGKLNYISASVFWYRDQNYYNDGWHGTKEMDGGVLLNQAIHFVDMVQFISKKSIIAVSAYSATTNHVMECEDVITINLKFSDGTLGNIQANTISYPKNYEGSILLFFDKATIKIGGSSMNEIIYWGGDIKNSLQGFRKHNSQSVYGVGHNEIIKNMNDSLLINKEIIINGAEGIKSIKVIEAIYKSINLHKEIIL